MVFLCTLSMAGHATDYYVSSSGSDSANGLSSSTPWRSLSKVNSEFSRFTPGDKILFKRGEIFQGTLTVSKAGAPDNPIVFDAYDSGSEPVISGFTSISSWTNEGGGIYSKSINCQSAPNILTLDDKNVAKGRWPNAGWMIIDTHSGSTSLTDAALPSSPDWNGAEIIVRTTAYVVDRSVVNYHSGQTLTYSPLTLSPVDGSGYFIQNHQSALDVYGEWCYTNGTLYMYFGSENPANHIVKTSVLDKLVDINYKNYITFRNILFEGGNVSGVHFYNSDFITIENCIIEKGGRYGILGSAGSDNVKIENNRVTNNNNIGIYFEWNTCVNTNISNNIVTYSGYLLGMGLSGYDSYCGIINSGDNSVTSYNKVENSGYSGIKFGGENAVVSYNFINYSCLNKDDGGGIYTFRDYNPNKVIKYNIVLNSLAKPDGWPYYEEERSHGIYLDGSYNVLVTHNTVASNDGCGIFMNAGRGVTSEFNTCYDNVWGIRVLSEPDIGLARNHNINNNILVAKELVDPSNNWNQSAFGFVSKLDAADLSQFGTSDFNYIARPVNNDNYIEVWKNAWGWAPGDRMAYNLSEWQSLFGKDSHSSTTSVTVSDPSKIRFEYNASTSNKVISLDGNYIDVKGAKYSGSITVLPYSSVLLIPDPNPSAPPVVVTPPVAAAPVVINTPPVAVVNYPSTSFSGFISELNASGSYDADKDNLSFTWKIPNNISVSATNSSVIKILAPIVETKQTYDFTLTISDGKTTQSKTVPVEVLPYQPGLETAEVIAVEAGDFQTPYLPYNVIDGNIGTMWSAVGNDQWIILELKELFNIQHVKVAFQPGQKKESYFDVLGSNDKENWEPVLSKSISCNFSGDMQVFEFPPSKSEEEYRYIKLIGQGNSLDNWNFISEFRIFGYKHKKPTSYEDLIVKIYPNPAREIVNILIDDPSFNPDFINIVSLTGKILHTEKLDPAIRQFQIPVNFIPGIYIVQMGVDEMTMFTQKLIISR